MSAFDLFIYQTRSMRSAADDNLAYRSVCWFKQIKTL